MCGISGAVNKTDAKIDKGKFEQMTDIISHRGPDSTGYYYGTNFAMGHRRLAIIDLSDDGIQPIHYMDRYTIVFNGEIYNYIELREQLMREGYAFKSQTDTEVILASFDKWGKECVSRFNGMWSFALYDKTSSKIFCSRDRFGVKPFYFVNMDDEFLFGSEIKQLFVTGKLKAKVNIQRAVDFLFYGVFDHTEETLFEGVNQIRGGYNLIYDLVEHRYEICKWYDLKDRISDIKMDFSSACFKFTELFKNSVKLRLRSDVKVGSCLSGGMDSSSIVCMANNILRKESGDIKQETVSSCSDIKKYDEQEFIDAVVEKTGVVSHKVFPSFDELFTILDKIIWHQDEPFGSTSIFAQWNVFREAKRNNITVMFDGQGADEQLAGYHPFFGPYFAELLRKANIKDFKREASCFKRMHGYTNADILKNLANSFLSPKLRKRFSLLKKKNKLKWLKVKYDKEAIKDFGVHKRLRNLSIEQIIRTSLPMLLHYEDRNSMAFSIEARVPFLDYRLVEFNLGLKDSYKIKNGLTKFILREALKDFLPEKVAQRYDKMGFVTPEDVWIREGRTAFRQEVQNACDNLIFLVRKDKVLNWFDKHLENTRQGDYTIWRLICLGRWMKVFDVKY